MPRSLLTLLFVTCCKLALGQTSDDFNNGEFTLFPHYKEDVEYFANIIPDSTYLYWQCVYNPGPYFHQAKEQIVFEKGDPKYAKLIKKSKSGNGFMVSCPPIFCSYYIIAIRPDKTILQVDNSPKFKNFLGKIDNLDEVRLAVRDQHYTIHINSMKSGSYQERQDYYLLYLGDWESDMISDIKTSTKAILTKRRDFKVLESTSYK